jgi:hypothetical protein
LHLYYWVHILKEASVYWKRYQHSFNHWNFINNSQDKESTYICNRYLYKENVVFTENRILLKFKLEGNSIICKNMDKAGGHYAKWDKPGTKSKHIMSIYL